MGGRWFYLASEAVRRPGEIPSYLAASGHTAIAKLRYDSQLDLLRRLQRADNFLLIVLDACRFDYFHSHHDDFFDGTLRRVFSAASNTFEYVRTVWPGSYDLTYVSAATPINTSVSSLDAVDDAPDGLRRNVAELRELYQGYVPSDHFDEIVDIWRSAWDDDRGVAPPEAVTDAAIDVAAGNERMVAHYFQPHTPYIGGSDGEADGQSSVSASEASSERLPELYEGNLLRVLPSVARLITETEFDQYVLTADHGEALGEYGGTFHGMSHHPKVRVVPWMRIDGVDGSVVADRRRAVQTTESEASAVDRLRELGYIG